MPACEHCGHEIVGRRPTARYCSARCRYRAHRRRARGLHAGAFAEGGRRGRIPMGQPTTLDRLLEEARQEGYREGRELRQLDLDRAREKGRREGRALGQLDALHTAITQSLARKRIPELEAERAELEWRWTLAKTFRERVDLDRELARIDRRLASERAVEEEGEQR